MWGGEEDTAADAHLSNGRRGGRGEARRGEE